MNLKETYNKIAEDWFREVDSNHWWIKGLHSFLKFLPSGTSILDIGCGPGLTAKAFIKHGFKVTGFDFSEKMIEIAKREVPEGNFFVMDLHDVDTIKDTFEGIFLQNVLLHLPKKEIEDILKKVVLRLKRGGYMYVSVKEKVPDGPEEFIKTEDVYGYKIERFFSYFIKEELEKYLKDLHLEISFFNIVQSGKTRWMQIIGKKL